MKLRIPKYKHILRINPKTSPKVLKDFKDAVGCTGKKGFSLNGIKEQPQELVDRNWGETIATSSEARKASKLLYDKYCADNISEWRDNNWGVTSNVNSSTWVNKFTVYLEAEENISPAIIILLKKYNIDFYISYAEISEEFIENNCGLLKFKGSPEVLELGTNKFEKYAFGITLLTQAPLSFEEWEKTKITQTSIKQYYFENWIEDDARNKIKSAFEHKITKVANTMVNNNKGTWKKLSLLF